MQLPDLLFIGNFHSLQPPGKMNSNWEYRGDAKMAIAFALILPSKRAGGVTTKGVVDLDDSKPFIKVRLGKTAFGLSCSGGGSRAAYLAAAIVREIHRS